MNFLIRRPDETPATAFTFTELLAVLCTIALLGLIVLPVLARDVDSPERAVCLNNMKRIMAAAAMYSTDNNDSLPHPSWGAELVGPDNWCYATVNRGQDPELPINASATSLANCAGKGETSLQFSNQVRFFKIGQLARFVESQRALLCPTDWRESMSGKRFSYLARPLKLTSYGMNGAVGGYVGRPGLLASGATFKVTSFLPTDILLWEKDELEVLNFNDAGFNPESFGERISRRHVAANGEGMGVAGRAGATADFVNWKTFNNLISRRVIPNDLFCGPGYQ